jgi:hypothetical protein
MDFFLTRQIMNHIEVEYSESTSGFNYYFAHKNYTLKYDVLFEEIDIIIENITITTKNIPEDIQKKFDEYISDPFFEIEVQKSITQKEIKKQQTKETLNEAMKILSRGFK